MKIKKRNSNYELLRITSMLMIVIYHIIAHSNILANTTGMIHYILRFIEAILIVHVNSFVLVTGYYQCKSDFKFKKLVALNNQVWFYRAVICVVLILFNVITLNRVDVIRNIMPIDLGFYWFIDIYMLLYCLSPFLNILINKMDQKTFRKLLVTCFVVISLISTITKQQAVYNNNGYSLANFIFLYFIGSYFRIYKIEIWEFLKN
jgi:surface polysaccharide O-acyltransferase-like enzyme